MLFRTRAHRGLDGDRRGRDERRRSRYGPQHRGGRRSRGFLGPTRVVREECGAPAGEESSGGAVAAKAIEASADPGQINTSRGPRAGGFRDDDPIGRLAAVTAQLQVRRIYRRRKRSHGVQTGRIALWRIAALRMPPASGSTPEAARLPGTAGARRRRVAPIAAGRSRPLLAPFRPFPRGRMAAFASGPSLRFNGEGSQPRPRRSDPGQRRTDRPYGPMPCRR